MIILLVVNFLEEVYVYKCDVEARKVSEKKCCKM